MDWSWVAAPVVAVVGLVGVVYTAVSTSRANVKRLRFEIDQAELEREHAERDAIRESIEHVASVMLDAEQLTLREGDVDDPFDFAEEWPEWWDSRYKAMRTAVARVHDEDERTALSVVLEALTYANGVVRFSPQRGPVDMYVKQVAALGFELASAWLRGQPLDLDAGVTATAIGTDLAAMLAGINSEALDSSQAETES